MMTMTAKPDILMVLKYKIHIIIVKLHQAGNEIGSVHLTLREPDISLS